MVDKKMKIIFFDWAPVRKKSDIRSGGHVRRYYTWITLNEMFNVVPFRKKMGNINWKAIRCIFENDSILWVNYGCGRTAHLFVLLASLLRSNRLVIDVNDLAIQQKYVYKDIPYLKRIQLQIIERFLLQRADTIILSWPGLLNFFKSNKSKKILIMPPGVGEDELFTQPLNRNNGKKIAFYFGSMMRKNFIPKIINLFSKLEGWELHLVGLMEGEEIVENDNVKYLGSVSHDKLNSILSVADVILIPLPKNDYLDKVMYMKSGYALRSCKPLIATKLRGISEYISMVGLEDNVVYMEEWNLNNLKEALQESQNINIDPEKTIEKLRCMAWEPRFKKAIKIAFGISDVSTDQIEWV